MENKYINKQEFVLNNSKRIPVCIVVDCSGSMADKDNTNLSRMQRVNIAINRFYEDTRKNKKTAKAVEVMLIAVGNDATILNEFSSTEENPKKFSVLIEKNNLTRGIEVALEQLDMRKKIYKKNYIDYFQPWLIVLSDGGVNYGNSPIKRFKDIEKRVRDMEQDRILTIFPIFVQGYPQNNNYNSISIETYERRKQLLSELSNDKNRLTVIDVNNSASFDQLFQFLHRSSSSIANNKGFIKDENFSNLYLEADNSSLKENIDVDIYEYHENTSVELGDESLKESEDRMKILEDNKVEIEKLKNEYLECDDNSSVDYDRNDLIIEKYDKFDLFVNGLKCYPLVKKTDDKIIFNISLYENDKILVKHNEKVIFNDVVHEMGNFNIEIINEKIRINIVKKMLNIKTSTEIKKETKEIINKYDDWDCIL